jgi:hypothetical protein
MVRVAADGFKEKKEAGGNEAIPPRTPRLI